MAATQVNALTSILKSKSRPCQDPLGLLPAIDMLVFMQLKPYQEHDVKQSCGVGMVYGPMFCKISPAVIWDDLFRNSQVVGQG